MKIFDCITYFDEPMLFEIRLNILNKYVDQFLVAEAIYTHSGKEKKINFNKKRYPKFEHKIKHIIIEDLPEKIIPLNNNNTLENQMIKRINAARRIEFQRNAIITGLKDINPMDWIIYSDSDEIPNLENLNFNDIKEKKILFRQSMFYYKFNLGLPWLDWFGSKATRFKNLKSISDLRNIKPKKYSWWRFDTLLKKNKFISVKIIKNGGWHFTELKSPKKILEKHHNDEHHDEFDLTGINEDTIRNMINNKYISYDHNIDQKNWKKKWNKENKISLSKIENKFIPNYLVYNKNKYRNWFN